MDLKNIMLSERNQSQETTDCMIAIIILWNVQNRQTHRDRKQKSGRQQLEGVVSGEWVLNWFGVLLWSDGDILELDRGGGWTASWVY